jgi:hypothetical protein
VAEERGRKVVSYIEEHFTDENISFADLKGVIDVETLWSENDVPKVAEHFKAQKVDAIMIIAANFGNEEAAGALAKDNLLVDLMAIQKSYIELERPWWPSGIVDFFKIGNSLYFLSGDTDLVASLMKQLNTEGVYTVPASLKEAINKEFWAGYCDDAAAKATIAKVFKEQNYLCDTHTATGWAVAEDYVNKTGDTRPMVVLSTASAYKFPAAVLSALEDVEAMDEFAQMEYLSKLTATKIPANLSGLQEKKELHTGVIEKTAMLEFVTEL